MKKFLSFCFFLSFTQTAFCQVLQIDSTRFITGNECCVQIAFTIHTADKGILFVGSTSTKPGGIIPFFPMDTSGTNVLIGKIDTNQKISWIKVYGGSNNDAAASVCQTPDGGYAVLAGTESNNGDVTGFKGGTDIWLLRLDENGNLLWQKCYGSSMNDAPLSIANTPDHGFILLGLTNGSDGDIPFHYGSTSLTDWAVIKTDSAGAVQWSKDMGGTEDEGFGSILAVDNGYYIVCTSGSIDHDCTDTAWHPLIGGTGTGNNYYLLRLDSAGNKLWDSSYGGSHSDWISYAMFDTRDSSIVIVGSTQSPDYMITGYHGGGDIWVIKVKKNGKLLWQKTLGSAQEENGTSVCVGPNSGYVVYGSRTYGPIGGEDGWLFVLDSGGDTLNNIFLGGTDNELPNSIVPYLNGYVATGISASDSFIESANYGRNCIGENAYITYIGYIPVKVNNVYQSKQLKMQVWPNPTQDRAKIIIPFNEEGTLKILNTLGQIVYKEEVRAQNIIAEINISGWANGLYLVQWHNSEGIVQAVRLIKN